MGFLDLALVPRLVTGRTRWPCVSARAAANVLTVAYCLLTARGTEDVGRVRAVALVLTTATTVDTAAAVTVRRVTGHRVPRG